MNDRKRSKEDYFEELFFFYAKGLVIYARKFLGTVEEAEDVVHDVFLGVWERLDRLKDENMKVYLFNSTKNRCLNYLTRVKRNSAYEENVSRQNGPEESDIEMFVETEVMDLVRQEVSKLPPQQQKVFTMNKFERLSYLQISEQLSLSPRTVDKHLELAIRTLRKRLSENIYLLGLGGMALPGFLLF